jgi:signal transduction protein with GAF and PtsI domain
MTINAFFGKTRRFRAISGYAIFKSSVFPQKTLTSFTRRYNAFWDGRERMSTALQEDVRKVLEKQGTSDLAFESIAAKLLATFDAKVAIAYTLDGATGMLKLRCHSGISRADAEKLRFLRLGKGLPGQTAALRQPLQAIHAGDCACPEELETLPPGSLFVPMVWENSLRGVLGIAQDFHREYAPDEVAALASIARLIADYLK